MEQDRIEAYKATYDIQLSKMPKRKQNDVINEAERLLKLAIPNYNTLGKVKYAHKFEIYYNTPS
jgi:hypothetical protein